MRAAVRALVRGQPFWVIVVCLLARAPSVARPCLSDDEAIYAVVAREMLAGRTLYHGVVDHKPPLVYGVYALTQALAGPRGGMVLLHLMTIAVVALTALVLRRIVADRGDGDEQAPLWAALLYAVFTTTLLPFDALAANCELFMMLPLTASVLLFLRGLYAGRGLPMAAAGAMVGVAMLFKYQAGVQLPLYLASLLVVHRRRPGQAAWAMAALVLGVLATLAGALTLLYAMGALDAAWFWLRFNASYIKTGSSLADSLRRAAARVTFTVAAAGLLWLLGARAAWRAIKGGNGRDRFTALWLLASALAVTTGGRFFGHYFHQITAPLAVLAAPAAARLWRTRRRLVGLALAGPALAFFALAIMQSRVLAAAGEREPDYGRIAALIASHARPSDSLVVWGNVPVLYFVAERPLGTRFVFSNYMTGLSPATPSQSDPTVDASANIVPESWDMFEADLARRKPRLFVDTSPGNLAAYGKFPPSKFPRLAALVARDYELEAEAAGVRLFVRRQGGD